MSDVTFSDLGLSKSMLESLQKKGYTTPTPIQTGVIPYILKEKTDLIAQAGTGTGKTGAFGIPLLELIDDNKPVIQALILAPTRELALQVASELTLYKGSRRINIISICGGQSITNQIQQLRENRSPCIIVGTPGRIIDHLSRKRLHLSEIQYLILDEVDEMLSIGFKEEIDTILAETNSHKRTFLFSATLPPYALTLAKTYLKEPKTIRAVQSDDDVATIKHEYYEIQASDKFNLLCRIIDLDDDFYGMIFCNTKRETDEIRERLVSAGYNAESLHGDLSQAQRELVLMKLKKRMVTILVVTDVAARGIDVKGLSCVINYNVPQNAEAYTHRMGRTGRAGASGYAVTFVQSNDFFKFRRLTTQVSAPIEKQTIPNADQVVARKKAALIKRVTDTVAKTDTIALATDLLSKLEPEKLVAALLEVAFKGQLDSKRYPEIREFVRGSGGGDDRGRSNRYGGDRRFSNSGGGNYRGRSSQSDGGGYKKYGNR